MNTASANSNPYQPPSRNGIGGLDESPVDYRWRLWSVLVLGIFAGVASVISTSIYSQAVGEIPNAPTARISWLTHYFRISTFYVAGAVFVVGFVLRTRQQHRSIRTVVVLSTLAFVAQLAAEICAIVLTSIGLFDRFSGILLNMFLRSAMVICVIHWFLQVPIRVARLGAVLIIGTLLWWILMLVIGFLGFTFCWSLSFALQIWVMQLTDFRWDDAPRLSRRDFLPNQVDIE